jgi:hypothetical protein
VKLKYDVIIPSFRLELAAETLKCFDLARVFDGTNYPSFSKLVNDCIVSATKEIVIISNDKARPNKQDVEKMLSLIDKGFGFVAMFRYGFFGFKKDLIRKIGFFDEGFLGGGYEDLDFNFRVRQANIAMYQSEEIKYIKTMKSSWKYDTSRVCMDYFYAKWPVEKKQWKRVIPPIVKPRLPNQHENYDIGKYLGAVFLPFDKTSWRL